MCSSQTEEKSHIISRLHSYHRNWKTGDQEKLRSFVADRLRQQTFDENLPLVNASTVDDKRLEYFIIHYYTKVLVAFFE